MVIAQLLAVFIGVIGFGIVLEKMVENNKGTIEISNEEDAGDNLLQFQIVLPV